MGILNLDGGTLATKQVSARHRHGYLHAELQRRHAAGQCRRERTFLTGLSSAYVYSRRRHDRQQRPVDHHRPVAAGAQRQRRLDEYQRPDVRRSQFRLHRHAGGRRQRRRRQRGHGRGHRQRRASDGDHRSPTRASATPVRPRSRSSAAAGRRPWAARPGWRPTAAAA